LNKFFIIEQVILVTSNVFIKFPFFSWPVLFGLFWEFSEVYSEI